MNALFHFLEPLHPGREVSTIQSYCTPTYANVPIVLHFNYLVAQNHLLSFLWGMTLGDLVASVLSTVIDTQ